MLKKCTPLWREAHLSQNVQNTTLGALLEVEMLKKCTPLWREAHFEVKMLKTPHVRTTFGSWDVEKVHTVLARSTFRSQKCKQLLGMEHFWTFRCRFAWQAQGIVHLVRSEKNVRVLWHFQKRWQAWDIWRGSGKMHFPCQLGVSSVVFVDLDANVGSVGEIWIWLGVLKVEKKHIILYIVYCYNTNNIDSL